MICPLQIFGFVEPLIELTINIVGFFSNIGISKIYCIIPNIKEIITYYVMSLYLYYMLRRDYIYKIKHFNFNIRKKGKYLYLISSSFTNCFYYFDL